MITALQGAKLKAANQLKEASDQVANCVSLICFEQEDIGRLRKIKEQIDDLFQKVISNEY